MTPEPGSTVRAGASDASSQENGGALARPRVLPTPPPLPFDELGSSPAGWLAPVVRPRPVAPAIYGEAGSALSVLSGEALQSARLADEIDALQQRTLETVSDNGPLSDECQDLLSRARAALQSPVADTAQVEDLLAKVRTVLSRAELSMAGARRYGPRLAAYGGAWLLALLFVLVFDRELAAWVGGAVGRTGLTTLSKLVPFWMCMVWAGIGATAASLYGLYRHVVRRDFDREYSIGYLVQPPLGVVVGALVYLVTAAVFFVIGEAHTLAAADITATNPLALVSALAGFSQRHAYALVDRAARRLTGAAAAADSGVT